MASFYNSADKSDREFLKLQIRGDVAHVQAKYAN